MPAACAVILAGLVIAAHWLQSPGFALFHLGVDQQRYLTSARAWAAGDLSPTQHHYFPLYPLMGAAFVWLTPGQPFMVPDLLYLLASLFLFIRIGRRLAPGWGDAVFALCFSVAVLSGKWLFFWLWVVPWTSSGEAPLQYATLLLALRFAERTGGCRAFPLGLCLGLAAGIRPGDAAVLGIGCGFYVLYALLHGRAGPRLSAISAGAGVLGLGCGLLPWVMAQVAISGLSLGAYAEKSASIGFEWRLLPMRWVCLVIDPRPLLPEGNGMGEVLPWVFPGIAGMLFGLMPRAGYRLAPAALVAATLSLHWALYLSYRDLQPYGLWRFTNVHYFKWTFPFLVLGCVQLAAALARRGDRVRACLACALTLCLILWRPVRTDAAPASLQASGHSLLLAQDLTPLDSALALPLSGSWRSLYFGAFVLHAGGRDYRNTFDFKVLPVPAGALLVPLRPLPRGPAMLDLPDDVSIGAAADARRFAQSIRPGVPCGVFPRRANCVTQQ